MKRIAPFLVLSLLIISTSAFSQHIFQSSVLYKDAVHPTLYIFVKSDAEALSNDWKTYLSKIGKVNESKGELVVINIKNLGVSSDLEKIVSHVKENDDFSVVSLILLDENNRSLAKDQIDSEAVEKLLYDFYDLSYYNEELRMAGLDLEWAAKLNDDAEKEQSRAERALASNLRAQEKLGKKLQQSPEELSKIIMAKDEVYQQILQRTDETIEPDEDLEKEFSKTEKKIIKTKNKAERNAAQLKKREAAFEELTDKLFITRDNFTKTQEVLESKKVVLQDLKRDK